MGQCCGLNESTVHDTNTVVYLVLLTNTTKDADRVGDGGLVDDHLSESTFEGSVLFDVLAVFCESRGADAAKLTTSQERFEQVCGVHTPS